MIAPKRVAELVWPAEAKTWRPDLSVAIAAGTKPKRWEALRAGADITVIGRDNIRDVLQIPRFPWRTVVLDELSSFKNRNTIRWKSAQAITFHAEQVWGLTGTPASNGLGDLWAQLYLLDQGERLGKYVTHFRRDFFTPKRALPNGIIPGWDLREGAEKRIYAAIEDICLSMGTDGRVKLPPVTRNLVQVPLPEKAQRAYKEMCAQLAAQVAEGEVVTAANAAVLRGKLLQITAGFVYDRKMGSTERTEHLLHTAKLDTLEEIIEGSTSPVLVYYGFEWERERILARWPKLAHDLKKTKDVEAKWNRGDLPILVTHPASAGHGLNLQHGGHTAVWTTPSQSPELTLQANKRLPRQGQKHPVVIHYLVAPDTVDKIVLDTLDGKATVEQSLLEHLERTA